MTYRVGPRSELTPRGAPFEPIWNTVSKVLAIEGGAPLGLPVRTITYTGERGSSGILRKLGCTPEGGVVVWEHALSVFVAESGSIARTRDAIAYLDDERLVCVDLGTGRERWSRACGPASLHGDDEAISTIDRRGRRLSYRSTDGTPCPVPVRASDLAAPDVDGPHPWRHELGAWEAVAMARVGGRIAILLAREASERGSARLAFASTARIETSLELGACERVYALELDLLDGFVVATDGTTTWLVDAHAERVIMVIERRMAVQHVGALAGWRHPL